MTGRIASLGRADLARTVALVDEHGVSGAAAQLGISRRAVSNRLRTAKSTFRLTSDRAGRPRLERIEDVARFVASIPADGTIRGRARAAGITGAGLYKRLARLAAASTPTAAA